MWSVPESHVSPAPVRRTEHGWFCNLRPIGAKCGRRLRGSGIVQHITRYHDEYGTLYRWYECPSCNRAICGFRSYMRHQMGNCRDGVRYCVPQAIRRGA